MKFALIALAGGMGSGKTTCVRAIQCHLTQQHPGVRIVTVSFAAPIKEAVHAFAGADAVRDAPALPGCPNTVARCYQLMGDAARDMFGADVLTRRVERLIEEEARRAPPDAKVVVLIDDLRLPSEAEWVHTYPSGLVVRLSRPEEQRTGSFAGRDTAHATEALCDQVEADLVLQNEDLNLERLDALGRDVVRRVSFETR